jgi:hypothetical protein
MIPSARRLLVVFSSVGVALATAAAEPGQDRSAVPAPAVASTPTINGTLPVPLPLLPPDNWWNLDVSAWPLDPESSSYISFIGTTRSLHPDFGGEVDPGSAEIYGFPFVVVGGGQPKKAVSFYYGDESDGVDHTTGLSFPFYPIPDQAITQPHWIEGGPPGNQDVGGDRHMLIVDRDNRHLYELYDLFWNGTGWEAGSGAFFDLDENGRRPEGWTSADAAGLAILPGLIRYDEVFGPDEIDHAFRFTVRATNGHVYPASHTAGSTAGALPMGARLRLKASTNISGFAPQVQKIFRAMKKYGLIVADNGSDMYISGAFDTRWDNDVLNPAFASLHASDFEVIRLGENPSPAAPPAIAAVTPSGGTTAGGTGLVVTGTGFQRGATLQLGSTSATDVVVDRSTRLFATTPIHAAEPVSVTVANPDAQSGAAGAFTYCSTAPAAPTISSPWWVPIDAVGVTASVPAVAGRSWVWSLGGGLLTSGQGTNAVTLAAGPPGTTMTLRVSEVPADGCASPATVQGIQADFLDVPPSRAFHDFVDKIALRRITAGCGNGSYCPDSPTTRAQMAVFLLRAKYGSSYVPPAATGVFSDVPADNAYAPYIERLYAEGVTGGCAIAPLRYCPNAPVTRAQMAVFLLRTKYGSGYVPPAATGVFSDVPANNAYAPYIERLYAEGVTGGCAATPLRYCPAANATRGQMAVFISSTFGF